MWIQNVVFESMGLPGNLSWRRLNKSNSYVKDRHGLFPHTPEDVG